MARTTSRELTVGGRRFGVHGRSVRLGTRGARCTLVKYRIVDMETGTDVVKATRRLTEPNTVKDAKVVIERYLKIGKALGDLFGGAS